jgi:hypothetical protein
MVEIYSRIENKTPTRKDHFFFSKRNILTEGFFLSIPKLVKTLCYLQEE